jgi:succinoglycan biosynthesis protein ExoV
VRVMVVRPEGKPNFGDELNGYIWPRFIPVTPDDGTTFYGVGSVLHIQSEAKHRIVFGAGLGYGDPIGDASWYFVRGPLTAANTGADYITDPGILVNQLHKRHEHPTFDCSYMPRWDGVDDFSDLRARLDVADIHAIDPRAPVDQVIGEICDSSLLLSEALHGAVVANALRIPWISVYGNPGHEFKWYDWCGSLEIIWNAVPSEKFSLSWIRDYAVPQLTAPSVLFDRTRAIRQQIAILNKHIEQGVYQ